MKKGIALAVLMALGLRLALMAGAEEAVGAWLSEVTSSGALLSATLSAELGGPVDTPESGEPETDAPQPEYAEAPLSSVSSKLPAFEDVFGIDEDSLEQELPEAYREANIRPTTIPGGMRITNDTSFEVDVNALLAEGLNIRLDKDSPQILIIHTHGSEAYTPDPINMYSPTDTMRTEDSDFNIIRVGDEFTAALESYGLNVIHDRGLYDYPSYTGSYTRSGAAIESYLAQYPSIKIVIDMHRDALGSGDVVYKTVAEVKEGASSQIMLLVGTGENGLYHPEWDENLKLALAMQSAAGQKYSTLMRPIALKQERYNQHLTTGSLIMEVGSSGNTLDEALAAVRLFADSVGPTLSELVE